MLVKAVPTPSACAHREASSSIAPATTLPFRNYYFRDFLGRRRHCALRRTRYTIPYSDSDFRMSTPNTLANPSPSATRRRIITQGVKLVGKSLENFIGVPGVQDFVHNAQELVVALKVGFTRFYS